MSDDVSRTQLYVIRHEHGYVKIGKSDDPEKRVRALQTACPYELEVYTTFDVSGDWQGVEEKIHETYDDHRVRGEWFDLPARELVYLSELTTVYADAVLDDDEWTPEYYIRELANRRGRLVLDGKYEVGP